MYVHAAIVFVCTRVRLFGCVCIHTQVHTHTCLRGLCVHALFCARTPCVCRPEWKGKIARASADRLDATDA